MVLCLIKALYLKHYKLFLKKESDLSFLIQKGQSCMYIIFLLLQYAHCGTTVEFECRVDSLQFVDTTVLLLLYDQVIVRHQLFLNN